MPNDFEIFIKILLSIALGFIIGLERNTTIPEGKDSEKLRLGGVRTFIIISLLGALSGITFTANFEILTYILFVFMIILVLISYILYFFGRKSLGITTEVATVISFLIGFAVTSEFISIKITLALVVIVAYILSQKEGIHLLIKKIDRQEVAELIKFAVIALAILPFLPDVEYTIKDLLSGLNFFENSFVLNYQDIVLFNPYKLWFIVVLITGINTASHFFSKIFGNKNAFFMTTFFSGLVSSTSIAATFATESKSESIDKSKSKRLAAGALISHGASFIPILLLTLTLNYNLFKDVAAAFVIIGIISITFGLYTLYLSKDNKNLKDSENLDVGYFSLTPAIKFIFILVSVSFLAQVALEVFGNSGFYISTILSSLVGMDPVVVTISELAGDQVVLSVAAMTFFGAVGVNAIWKLIYSFLEGDREYYKIMSIGLLVSFFVGFLAHLFM